jgi:hypothetical protein
MALYLKNEDWRAIAEQVSNEMDPAKLTILVAQLCRALNGGSDNKPQVMGNKENQTESLGDVA